jgi:hypothetical protein
MIERRPLPTRVMARNLATSVHMTVSNGTHVLVGPVLYRDDYLRACPRGLLGG